MSTIDETGSASPGLAAQALRRLPELPWGPAVWFGWAVLTGIMLSYVLRFGQNLPIQDEWWFVPVLVGDEPAGPWIIARHNEHRFIFGRAVYLGIQSLSRNDFRAGMVLSLVLLATAAALLLWCARRLRGRLVPADFVFPALLLNGAHGENLTMSYQVVFTLTTAAVTAFLTVVALSASGPPARILRLGSLVLIPIALGGAPGVTFGPPLAIWAAYFSIRSRSRCHWTSVGLGLVIPLAILAYSAWILVDVANRPTGHTRHSFQEASVTAIEFLTVGLGTAGREAWPVFGYLIGGLYAFAGAGLTAVALRRPDERPVALGLLVVMAGTVASAFAVGWTRTGGMESRYTSLACLGLAAIALAFARYVPWRPLFLFRSLAVIALAILFLRGNWLDGRLYAHVYRHRIQELKRDADRGVPLEVLADRHIIFPIPEYRDSFRKLRDHGFPTLANVRDDPPMRVVDLPVPSGSLARWEDLSPPPRADFSLAEPVHVLAVRVHYRVDYARYWQQFRLTWMAENRPDAPIQTAETHPWLVPGDGVLAFWIDGPVARFWLTPDSATTGLPITRVSLYLPQNGP